MKPSSYRRAYIISSYVCVSLILLGAMCADSLVEVLFLGIPLIIYYAFTLAIAAAITAHFIRKNMENDMNIH